MKSRKHQFNRSRSIESLEIRSLLAADILAMNSAHAALIRDSAPVLDASSIPFEPMATAFQYNDRASMGGLKVALISDAVAQAGQVLASAMDGVETVVYDSQSMTSRELVELLAAVSATHGGATIDHLAIMTHGSPGSIELGVDEYWNLGTLPGDAMEFEGLRSVLSTGARLDLYACSVASGVDGRAFVDQLALATGADVYASDNLVGSGDNGDFNWEFKSAQSAIIDELFSIQELEATLGLLLPDTTRPVVSSATASPTSIVQGTTLTVNWNASDNVGVHHLGLYLYAGGVAVNTQAFGGSTDGALGSAALNVSNTGVFRWTIPMGLAARSGYSVKVVAWDAAGNAGYRFTSSFEVTVDDRDDQISEAINLDLMSQTRTRNGDSIDVGKDVDMFSFGVNAGQRIAFDIDRPSGTLDSYIRVFDNTGRELGRNDDGPNPLESSSYESYLEMTFAAAGTYYIGVSGYGNSSYDATTGAGDRNGRTGAFTLILTPVAVANADDNDQISEAISLGAMTANRTWQLGTIDSPTDVDMFSFSVNAGQRIAFDIDRPSGSLDSYIRVFDINGREIGRNDDGPNPGESYSLESYLELTFAAADTYFVGVSGYGNSSYDATTGSGDRNGSTGAFTLIVSAPRSITGTITGYAPAPGLRDNIQVTLARADGGSEPIDPTLPTWLIIHGRESDPRSGFFPLLVQAVGNYSDGDQVLTLDWSAGAFDNGISRGLAGSRWISDVAAWAARTLQQQGISGSRLDEIGHSWGAHVGNEIAQRFAAATGSGVRSFVALDPAVLLPGGYYDRRTEFNTNALRSWAFNSSAFGSNESANSAHESFNLTVEDPEDPLMVAAHSNVIDLFSTIVNQNNVMSIPVSRHFNLSRLLSGTPDTSWSDNPTGFEADLHGTFRNGHWEPISMQYGSTVEFVTPDLAGNSREQYRDVGLLNGSTTFSDWVGTIDSSDYYRFSLLPSPARQNVTLMLTGLSADTAVVIYNSSGGLPAFYPPSNSSLSISLELLASDGPFYARVVSLYGNTYYSITFNIGSPTN